ncbi:MAG: SUMF1/EgtB/PvdO family nonheme iron enzyme [Planctomycetota bacterium]
MGSPPERIGPYELLCELGRGGTGVVYEARDPAGRRVALKLLDPGLVRSPDALLRFQREAELLARVRHPHVLPVHELGRSPRGPYLVTALLDGQGLDAALSELGPRRPSEAARMVRDLADGVAAAHAVGVLHRDLKPANVHLDAQGRPVLLDFGLARAEDLRSLTETGVLLGTPAYMAPEQLDDARRVSPTADVYGLGAILLSLLTGRAPFAAASLMPLLQAVIHDEPEWPRDAPPALLAILQRALAKDPARRPGSALELRDELDAFLRGAPTSRRQRRPARMALAAALVALVLGALAVGRALLSPIAFQGIPTDAPRWSRSPLVLEGSLAPGVEVAARDGDQELGAVICGQDGAFRLSLELGPGERRIELTARRGLARAALELKVTRDEQPPTLELDDLVEGHAYPREVGATGRVRDAGPLSLSLQGPGRSPAPLEVARDGTFGLPAPEREPQALTLVARDAAGNEARLALVLHPPADRLAWDALWERERWRVAPTAQQERAARLVAMHLGEAFVFVELRRFECEGLSYRLAIYRHRRADLELVLLPGGRFTMGTPYEQLDAETAYCRQFYPKTLPTQVGAEAPAHPVAVPPFLIARTRLSRGQLALVTGAEPPPTEERQLVALGSSWDSAQAWLQRAGGGLRLPSEAEWEYAASGGREDRFGWGPNANGQYGRGYQALIQTKVDEPRPTAFGVVWMLGGAGEWCEDDAIPGYLGAPVDGAPRVASPRLSARIIRGGGDLWTGGRRRARALHSPDSPPPHGTLRAARSVPAPPPPRPAAPAPARPALEGPPALPAAVRAGERPGDYVATKDGSPLVWVPPGSFRMGHDGYLREAPSHPVRLTRGFFLGKHEVSWARLERFCREAKRALPPRRIGDFVPPDDHPAVNVTLDLAQAYCRWLGGRLPTEAEWEWAARGPDSLTLPWGGSYAWTTRANLTRVRGKRDRLDGYPYTAPVDAFPEGAGPFGALNQVGNVMEWVQDAGMPQGYASRAPVTDPEPTGGLGASVHICRGGSWDTTPENSRGSSRFDCHADQLAEEVGLRVCIDAGR